MMSTAVFTMPYDTKMLDAKEESVERIKRFATNCSTWSPWINKNTPNATNMADHEFLTSNEMENFCPKSFGGNITKMACLNARDGPFNGTREDEDHVFIFRCLNITEGVVCEPKRTLIDTCPDVAVKFFCTCTPPTRTPNLPIIATPKTTTSTSGSSVTYLMSFLSSTSKQTESTVALTVVHTRRPPSTLRYTKQDDVSGAEKIGLSFSNDDSYSEEENEMMYDKLSHTMLMYDAVPTIGALSTLIILCCIIIALVCKLQKPTSIGPLPDKPMGTGHLF
ncbi:hypothetical protein ACF0H5_003185 [Mactra antiquata]